MERGKVARNLDGFYLRVERYGVFENRCFTDLTEDEQAKWLARMNTTSKHAIINGLLESISTMMDIPDIKSEELDLIAMETARYVYNVGAILDIEAKYEGE